METQRPQPPQRPQQQGSGMGNQGQQSQEMPQGQQTHTQGPGQPTGQAQGQEQTQGRLQHKTSRPDRDHSHIKGWGADLDHANRPAHPRERTPPRLEGLHWNEPEQQPVTVTILQSNERPSITPVFGTTVPPSGLSGILRTYAFTHSENDIRHWMLLLVADRINVVEGIGQDLMRGHVPNLFKEFGWRADMKHNPRGFAQKMVVTGAVIGLGVYLLRRRRSRRRVF